MYGKPLAAHNALTENFVRRLNPTTSREGMCVMLKRAGFVLALVVVVTLAALFLVPNLVFQIVAPIVALVIGIGILAGQRRISGSSKTKKRSKKYAEIKAQARTEASTASATIAVLKNLAEKVYSAGIRKDITEGCLQARQALVLISQRDPDGLLMSATTLELDLRLQVDLLTGYLEIQDNPTNSDEEKQQLLLCRAIFAKFAQDMAARVPVASRPVNQKYLVALQILSAGLPPELLDNLPVDDPALHLPAYVDPPVPVLGEPSDMD